MLKAALLERCDHLVVGSGVMAMIRALSLPVGETVLLIGEDTCLYGDIDRTGDLRVPRGLSQAWETLLFPPQTRDCDGLLHPDRLKRYGEELFARRGIRLLYACQVLGLWEGMALVAHKSGLYAVGCGAAYDCRDGLTPQDARRRASGACAAHGFCRGHPRGPLPPLCAGVDLPAQRLHFGPRRHRGFGA